MALDRGDPPDPCKYIKNVKLTKYSRCKISGWLVCDLRQLELTIITGKFGPFYRQVYRKVNKQASMQAGK